MPIYLLLLALQLYMYVCVENFKTAAKVLSATICVNFSHRKKRVLKHFDRLVISTYEQLLFAFTYGISNNLDSDAIQLPW